MTVEDSRKILPADVYPSWVVFSRQQKVNFPILFIVIWYHFDLLDQNGTCRCSNCAFWYHNEICNTVSLLLENPCFLLVPWIHDALISKFVLCTVKMAKSRAGKNLALCRPGMLFFLYYSYTCYISCQMSTYHYAIYKVKEYQFCPFKHKNINPSILIHYNRYQNYPP